MKQKTKKVLRHVTHPMMMVLVMAYATAIAVMFTEWGINGVVVGLGLPILAFGPHFLVQKIAGSGGESE